MFVSPIPVVSLVESLLLFSFLFFVIVQRLELLDGYLSEFDASGADTRGSQVQWQKKKNDPWKVTEEFPAGEDSKGEPQVVLARASALHEPSAVPVVVSCSAKTLRLILFWLSFS